MKISSGTSKQKIAAWACIAAGLLLLAAANGHLVYMAAVSQPDCVPHVRQVRLAAAGEYRAAVSSCSVK
jgi:hypothetical protein